MQVIDVRNNTNPIIIGSVKTRSSSYGITLNNNDKTVYVADQGGGLIIINIIEKANP